MKIQCSCGVKYTFDVTPEMAQTPIRFVCQSCGLDASDFVNELIRQELALDESAEQPAPAAEPVASSADAPLAELAPLPAPGSGSTTRRMRISSFKPTAQPETEPANEPLAPPPPPAGAPRLKISGAAPVEDAAAPSGEAFPVCTKHPPHQTTHHCLVCQKPICPKCMELFGYVCSPFCNSKAEAQGIVVPVFAGKKSVAEAREWRKIGLVGAAIAAVVLGVLGFWFWYAWFGASPRPVYSIKFPGPVRHGQSAVCADKQIVFLRGDTLVRYDLKSKKEVWSCLVVDPKKIADAVQKEIKESEEFERRLKREGREYEPEAPDVAKLTKWMQNSAEAALQLYVHDRNIWLNTQEKLVRHDWESGKPAQEIPLDEGFGSLVPRGGELVRMDASDPGMRVIMHISLATGESRVEKIGSPTSQVAAVRKTAVPGALAARLRNGSQATAGLPLVPGKDTGKPLDPAKVAEEAQRLSMPAKIALPAVLANSMHQERVLAEMAEDEDLSELLESVSSPGSEAIPRFLFVPSQYGFMQISVRMIERNMVARQAMKDPPKKSILEGNVNASQSLEVANEILNDMQRSRGGGTVVEDQSRYQVTVRCPDKKEVPDWTGEVIGRPSLFPLKTVSVVAAGKSLTVLDRMNKKLWQAPLTHEVKGGFRGYSGFDESAGRFGMGPCVEREGDLYVFDEAVLTAFDLATGNARWRLPTVGVTGIFFDDKGMMYVNTSTASPDSVKYSRQIDVTSKTSGIVVKIDPKTGKTHWISDPGLAISHLAGKYIYTIHSADADELEENPYSIGMEPKSHVWIRRLDPKTGRVMGERYMKLAPLDVQFNGNTIQIVFKKELQVLKCFLF